MRQTAWLYTVPERAKEPRHKTRQVVMPPIPDGAGYLLEYLFEMGPCKHTAMGGMIGLEEADLLAWQINHDIWLSSWEIRAVRRLSQEYVAGCHDSKDARSQPPYVPSRDGISDEQRQRISDAMSSWADKLNRAKKRS